MNQPYWVYHNWHLRKAIIHLADCRHCNNGEGVHDDVSGENCEWLPFDTQAEALTFANKTGFTRDGRYCGTCLPEEKARFDLDATKRKTTKTRGRRERHQHIRG